MVPLSLFFYATAWGYGLYLYFLQGEAKLVLLFLLPLLLLFFFQRGGRPQHLLVPVLFLLFGFAYGYWDGSKETSRLSKIIDMLGDRASNLEVTGVIDSTPVVDGDSFRWILDAETIHLEGGEVPLHERVWVLYDLQSPEEKGKALSFVRGDHIRTRLTFKLPEGPRNPGAFHFPQYLYSLHITWTGKGEGLSRTSLLERGSFVGWRGIEELKKGLGERLDSLFSPEVAGVMRGMLLGDVGEIPEDLTEAYRKMGIIHVLAISGFHVMVVIGGLLLLLHLLGLTRERSYELLILFLPIYALLTGASPPVLRAVFMGVLYLLAKRFHQPYSAVKAISLSFIGMTLADPRQVLGLGFQLSYFVSLILLLFTRPLSDRIRRLMPRLPEWISLSAAVLILAQVISFPLLLTASHQWSFLVLPANLFLVPIFAFLIPWGYLSLLLSLLFPEAGKLLSLPLEGVMRIIHDGISGFGSFPSLFFSIPDPPPGGWILYLLFLFFFFSFLMEEMREGTASFIVYRNLILSSLFFLLFFSLPFFLSLFDREVRITFFDVGQGDAILVQGPNGESLLIDGGGVSFQPQEEWRRSKHPYAIGRDLLVPALSAMGVNHLDWVVVTHGDGDHIGGLKEVISSIPVNHLLGNGLPPTTGLERQLWREGEVRSIPAFRAVPGEFLHWGSQVTLYIHGPASLGLGNTAGENNASVLLFLEAYGRKILFTGDLEAEGEKEWLGRIGPLDLDLLKVGHHGSKSSTSGEFLDATRPEAAIISVGKTNRYGHPAPEVLKRLEERGIRIMRTDQLGAIQARISSDGALRLYSYPWK